jgi:hypothetical protein
MPADSLTGGTPLIRSHRGVLTTAMVVVALVGCTDDEGDLHQEQAAMLGFLDPDASPSEIFEHFTQGQIEVQELIVACMAEQGFEYIAWIPAPEDGVPRGMTAAEYKRLYGWGMMESRVIAGRQIAGEGPAPDPNIELRTALDEPTGAAWDVAMYGPVESRGDPDSREGCRAQAEFAAGAHRQTEAWQELAPLISGIHSRIEADPRSIEARRNWSQCMAEAGYPFDNVDEAIFSIDDRFEEAFEAATPPPGNTDPPNNPRWFEGTDGWNEVVQYELDLGAADTVCSQGENLWQEYIERFVEENQDLILQLQAELEVMS